MIVPCTLVGRRAGKAKPIKLVSTVVDSGRYIVHDGIGPGT
jgi:hypothetical protein